MVLEKMAQYKEQLKELFKDNRYILIETTNSINTYKTESSKIYVGGTWITICMEKDNHKLYTLFRSNNNLSLFHLIQINFSIEKVLIDISIPFHTLIINYPTSGDILEKITYKIFSIINIISLMIENNLDIKNILKEVIKQDI